MKRTRSRFLGIVIAVIFMLQMLPLNLAEAIPSSDLTGTASLVVHGTDYANSDHPEYPPSLLTIKRADGTPISPAADGSYNDVPAGATISLEYAFHLEDGDGTDIIDYTGDEFFTAELPEGLNFAPVSGTVSAVDSVGGYSYTLADWDISGNTLTVELTDDSEDPSGHGGAANDAHLNKWGIIHIDGTFKPLQAGDDTSTEIRFGSEVVVINRQPLPMESTLAKSGSYDASENKITWTVTITPPAGDPDMSYDGYSLIDKFGSGQSYVPGSFNMGEGIPPASVTSIEDDPLGTDLTKLDTSDLASRTISYTFPDVTGPLTVTYQTEITDFAAEDGTPDYSEYTNTASLKRGPDDAADPANADVRLNWLEKAGEKAGTTADPTIAKWTVSITVPGENGKSISGGKIVDNLQADLELITADPSHPVQIKFGSDPATNVDLGGGDGQYDYSGNTLTYFFPAAGQPTAGTEAKLTFYTRVKDSERDRYLDNNSNIPFTNGASLAWSENTTGTNPSDTARINNGVGSGGLLSKSSAGGTTNYNDSAAGGRIIHWTIQVNRSRINIENAKVSDEIPHGQTLLIDSEHTFAVTKKGAPDTLIYSDDGTDVNPATGTFALTTEGFSYEFPDEDSGDGLDDTIKSMYTLDYYTLIVDTDPGAPGDNSGLDTLYKNGNVSFGNGVTLTRSGDSVYTPGSKTYSSQMLDKSIATSYDYNERTVQWKIVVNRNRLLLTNGVVTDTTPSGMTLLIDGTHPFTVTAAGGGATGSLSGASGDTSFTYTLPSPTSDEYTLTFWTLMDEETLKTQWNGTRDFTNRADLDADEITTTITDSSKAQIKNPVITKSHSYVPNSHEDHIDWTAVINPGQVFLSQGVVTDELDSGLQLDLASVKLYEVSINSSTGGVSGTIGEVPEADYDVTLQPSAGGNTMTVELPENTSKTYQLEFTTNILVDDLTNLVNTIALSGSSGDPSGGSSANQINITNLYSGGGSGSNTLTVHKMNSDGNPLSGASFGLLNVSRQPITSSGHPVTRTTNASGDAVFSNLPSWVFYVEEIEPAPGYLLPDDPISGGQRLSGSETISVTDHLALGAVSFAKTGAGGAQLSGGTFTLTGKDYKNDDVSMSATSVNGTVSFSDVPLSKAGEHYTITETEPPGGHALSTGTLTATVKYNGDKTGVTVNVTPDTLENTPLPGTVSFSKTGGAGVPLTGGTFTLTGTDYTGAGVSMTASAASGTVTFADVPIGSYTIAETDPPQGYLLPVSTDILTAAVEYNPTNTGIVTTVRSTSSGAPVVSEYENTPALGSISFTKTNLGGSPLEGGTFTLTGTDYGGSPVALTASSVAGIVTFTGVPLGSGYIIRETIPPSGYVLSDEELTASVSYNGDKTSVVTSVNPDTLANKPESHSQTLYGDIKVIKTDESGNKLAGATFALYRQSSDSLVATAVTNAQGEASFNNVPEGKYVIRETSAPAGFVLSTESISVSITGTATRTFTMVNKAEEVPPGIIQIIKSDEDGNLLPGAEFTLYDAGGTALKSVVTGPDGRAVLEGIPAGTYTLSETRAPEGYVTGTVSYPVTVSSGETSSLTFTNQKISTDTPVDTPVDNPVDTSGSMQIKKVDNNSNPLSGAEFTLYDESGNPVKKAVSGGDGLVIFAGLAPGKYSVGETAAPEGYKLFTEPLVFSISSGEELAYTLRNNLLTEEEPDVLGWEDDNKPASGGTLPQTGGIPSTFYMAIAGLILLSAGLLLAKPKKYRKNRA